MEARPISAGADDGASSNTWLRRGGRYYCEVQSTSYNYAFEARVPGTIPVKETNRVPVRGSGTRNRTSTDDPIEYPPEGPTEYLPGEVVRHVGAELYNNRVLQILGNIEVTNPSVPHEGGDDHHFVARFLAEKDISGIGCPTVGSTEKCWIEVGWGEFEYEGDTRYVYTYSTDDPVTYTYQQYPLVDGDSYHFHIKYVGQDPPLWAAYFWWAEDEEWICLLHPDGDCERPIGFSYADGAEEFAEVATTSATGDFAIQNTEFGSDYISGRVQLQIGPGSTMRDWSSANFPDTTEENRDGEYSVTWEEKYDYWTAED